MASNNAVLQALEELTSSRAFGRVLVNLWARSPWPSEARDGASVRVTPVMSWGWMKAAHRSLRLRTTKGRGLRRVQPPGIDAKTQVGFEVVSFCPLVPRLYEYESLFLWQVPDGMQRSLEMPSEQLRGRPLENEAAEITSRCVVPVRDYAGQMRHAGSALPDNRINEVLVAKYRWPTSEVEVLVANLLHRGAPRDPFASFRRQADGHRRVVAIGCRNPRGVLMFADTVEPGESGLHGKFLPVSSTLLESGSSAGRYNHEQGSSINRHVTPVQERRQQRFKMPPVVVQARIGLLYEHAAWGPMPQPRPRLVRPAYTKGNSGSPDACTSLSGRSRICLPANQ